ncbi:MAG: potassium-transporting ATPase subunit KdpC [Lachnospiraceae bacterium]|nr:potassium-transporting ATPase subunit KdpC [Lachnospiraceae bacterium]
MKKKGTVFGKAVGMVLAMTLICGVLYTIVVTGVSQLFFSDKANGSVIEIDGKKYGCELLAQEFTGEEYMWGRIMNVSAFTDQAGNTKMYSGPSNLSPESQEYKELVEQRVEKIKEANPDADKEQIPEDLVTCSGSGLDPDISVAAAEYQVPRLAKANQMTEDEIQEIIDKCTNHKILGIFGEETVNVLKVNLMLEGIL